MPFTPKNVDDRTFESLVAEAKQRIPAYLPEWTDHNESDPGVALVQLFAWLTETAIFRLNQVPDDRMYVSFLNLIGEGPRPAAAATAIVELAVTPASGAHVFQPAEVQLSAPGEPDEIPFEPDDVVRLVGASLGALLVDDGINLERRDVMATNSDDEGSYPPFGPTRVEGRALYIGLDSTPVSGPPMLLAPGAEGILQLYVATKEKTDEVTPASTFFPPMRTSLDGDVHWEGKTAGGVWAPLQVVSDESRGLSMSGFIQIKLTGALAASIEHGDPDPKPRFWIRAVAKETPNPETREVRHVLINAVRVRQWRTFARELLIPGSDGTPSQSRAVLHPPILVDDKHPVFLEVNEPQANGNLEWSTWKRVDDLATRLVDGVVSTPGHPLPVFIVRPGGAEIELGDGIDGRIPPRGPNNLALTYRSGGGARGNVAKGMIAVAQGPSVVESAGQRDAARGGADTDDIERAKDRAPGRIRARERAVTADDFESIAREHTGVARASALNRFDPRIPNTPVTGAITLVVVPPRLGSERAPLPTQIDLDAVARTLEKYRVLTTELFVVGPRYRRIRVDVEIEVREPTDAGDARTAIIEGLDRFFDPIEGGPDGTGWPLARTVAYGEVMSVVLRAKKVVSVRSLAIMLDGVRQPACADVELQSAVDLLASEGHVVKVVSSEMGR